MHCTSLLLAALAVSAGAIPAPASSTLHEKRNGLPRELRRTGRVPGEHIIPLRIALGQSNLDRAYDYVLNVSHPSSPHYGKHWTADQVRETFAPAGESVRAVGDWLRRAGVRGEDMTVRKGWLAVDMPAGKAEELLGAEYHEHVAPDGSLRIGCDSYRIPDHLAGHIDFVKPGVLFSPPLQRTLRRRDLPSEEEETRLSTITQTYASEIQNLTASYLDLIANLTVGDKAELFRQAGALLNGTDTCGSIITPVCLRALYAIPEPPTSSSAGTNGSSIVDTVNELGLYESEGELWDQQDLDSFFATLGAAAAGAHPAVTSVNNATSEGPTDQAGGEALLDLDIAYSLIYPQSVRIFQSQGTASEDSKYYSDYSGYEALLDAIDGAYCDASEGDGNTDCGTAELTRVFSSSYGVPEIELPQKASERMCNEIMKLTLQGHTILCSSGDYGVASHPSAGTTGCIFPGDDPSATEVPANGSVFNPQSLDSCPYVLSVGATQIDANATISDPEVAAVYPSEDGPLTAGGTGGGFSNYFARPAYQAAAVQRYLASPAAGGYKTYEYGRGDAASIGAGGGRYNAAGRGFPDVSANGNNFLVFVGNRAGYTGGTSMSTPIWGSILTLVNQERTKAGKGPVGFVNPVLYEHPEIFHDITSGSNPGCLTPGFAATQGWDPVTGLGTPDYPKLLELFLSLP
ncbi:putative protease S8 tripeptidyl peptidase I [Xylariaceae sp. FL0804]|nr:putative protease S8 tripeptidyl peptidase I [Xylariaceae sp. FL0804]